MRFRFRDWPLRAKLAALLVAASLLPLGIEAYLDLREAQAQRLASLQDLLKARGDQIVHELDGFHRSYRSSVDRIAIFEAVTNYCAAGGGAAPALAMQARGTLAAYPAADANIRGAALLDRSGRVLLATEPALTGADLSYRSHVRAALGGARVISDIFFAGPQAGEEPSIAYLTPVLGPDGQTACVAALWVRASALWRAVKASNALAGQGSFAVLFDQQGIRIAHTYSDEIVFHPGGPLDPTTIDALVAEQRFGPRTRALLEDVRAFPEQFDLARSAAPSEAVFRGLAPVNKVWNYGVARRFAAVPWTVFYMVPETDVQAELARLTRDKLALAAALIAAAAVAGLLFATNILRPVRRLASAAKSIADGDLAARVHDRRVDELGQLGTSFDTMADRIQAQASDLQRSRDELEQRVQQRTAGLHRAQVMARLAHVVTRPDGSFESWSETLPPLIGLAPAQMLQSTREWLAILHPDDREHFRGKSIEAGITGLRTDVEYRLRRPDGTWVHIHQVNEPIAGQADAKGRMHWFCTLQDVTEQRRVEEARIRLAAIVQSSDDAIISKTLAGVITSWNPGAEKLFGYTAEDAVGQPMQMLVPPERSAEEPEILARIARGESVDHFETVRVRKDGSPIDVSATISPIRDTQGKVVGASKIARDITDRKHAQARLQAQLERLGLLDQITVAIGERQDLQSIYQVVVRSLEDRMPVDFSCVCRHDAVEDILTVIRVGAGSQALASELAMDEHARIEIDQNGLSRCLRGELVHEPDITDSAFAFPQRLARGGLRSLVVAPLRSESKVFGILVAARRQAHSFSSGECEFLRQLSAHVALAAQQAQLYGALQQAYDELRQTQQAVMQQERLRALGQMASGIAHDINNAISPVLLYTEALLDREPGLSERARGYLQTIARSIDDVAETVARLREFYRQREPQMTLVPLDLNALVVQVADLTRARWSDMPLQRGVVIRMESELAPDLPAVSGVESEVREALINLVFNAVDAMPEGGVMTMRTRRSALPELGSGAAAPCALVEVADTGMGMDDETRRRCLEPFFTTKGERGTGLGLAMVYGVAQRHGADLQIDSAAGRGTTVRMTFPVPAAAVVAPGLTIAPEAPTSRLRILVVDDDPIVLKSLCDTLQADGHVVVSADGGQAGIAAFHTARSSSEAFDVVITDLGMPYVDGRQVASAVKQASMATPVILLTGWGQRLIADNEVPAHIDRVLSKPPKLRELRAALARTIATRGVT
jgi:PAS domain S-box-containing protein